jgi:hypothetical protein
MDRRLTSTTFGLSGGPTTEDQLRAIWLKVSRVPDIGAIAFEVRDEGTTMILKHKESVVPDRVALRAAVRAAGPYDLV